MFRSVALSSFFVGIMSVSSDCVCGWRAQGTDQIYEKRIFHDFSTYPDGTNLLQTGSNFNRDWMVYDFWQNSDNFDIRLNAQYTPKNVQIRNGSLVLTQRGYNMEMSKQAKPISVAGIQSRDVNILHGTFRALMKLEDSTGGSCASFFWYHNDRQEIDIEAVTQGTSLVNNTINYTNQPSIDASGIPIPNATLSMPLSEEGQTSISIFRKHRFDCDSTGVKFFLDGQLVKMDNHTIASHGGSLQLKLWADGNQWWSGVPSTTDVHLSIRAIIAYYNTTQNDRWTKRCRAAGGSSVHTVCEGETTTKKSGSDAWAPTSSPLSNAAGRKSPWGILG